MEFEFIVNFRGETDYRSPQTGATRYRVRWHPNPEISDPAPVGTIRGHGLTLEIVRAFNAWTKQKHDADIVYIRAKYGDDALKYVEPHRAVRGVYWENGEFHDIIE